MESEFYAKHWQEAAPKPVGIKSKIRSVLRRSKLSALSIVDRHEEPSFLRCLYCHYIFDNQLTKFENIILSLKSMGEFINTDECIKMLKGERAINGKYFHLSFDDGFRNNYLNAFPILKKHAVPTLFFVPSAIIGADWSTTREYCLKTTRYRSIIEMMNWNDLRALTQDGYEIGSHTRTHARFSDISHSTQLMSEEILGSKAEIETQLGIPCKYISWPYGQLKDADTISLETVKSAGYTACFGAFRGTVSAEKTDIFSIPRHHFEAQWPLSHIKYFARGNLEKNLDQHRIMT